MPQKGTEKRCSSENEISMDRAALLWMYCREIAPFETPTFIKNVGELIARATSVPQKRAVRRPKTRANNVATSKQSRHDPTHPRDCFHLVGQLDPISNRPPPRDPNDDDDAEDEEDEENEDREEKPAVIREPDE
jgi:hypothetical protein